jgi:hypothetical protein
MQNTISLSVLNAKSSPYTPVRDPCRIIRLLLGQQEAFGTNITRHGILSLQEEVMRLLKKQDSEATMVAAALDTYRDGRNLGKF